MDAFVEYRIVRGCPDYRVGDDGSVWSFGRLSRSGRKLRWKLFRDKNGVTQNARVVLYPGPVDRLVHRLVLEAFIGPCPAGMECRHLDGNPLNNRLDNLLWGTHIANMEDAKRHGTQARGERSGRARLTAAKVLSMRERYAKGGITLYELAAEHDVSFTTIQAAITGRSWAHL